MTTTIQVAAAHAGAANLFLPIPVKPSGFRAAAGAGGGSGGGGSSVGSVLGERICTRLPSVPGVSYLTTVSSQGAPPRSSRIGRRQEFQFPRTALRDQAQAAIFTPTLSPDLFLLDLASKLEDSIAGAGDGDGDGTGYKALSRLREEATEATLSCRWPTNKDEAYRFTDLKFLKQANIFPVDVSTPESGNSFDLSSLNLFMDEGDNRVIFVDGVFSTALSKLEGLPEGVVVGSISTLSKEVINDHVLPKLSGVAARSQGDVFACLNGVGAPDLGVVLVPAGVKVPNQVQIVYISTQGVVPGQGKGPAFGLSNPRLLVIVERGAELNFVEDFLGAPDAAGYWTNSVCEIAISKGGQVVHNLVQEQTRTSVHIRQTYISQAEASSYKLVEACFGGRLSRHNLHVQQLGPDTVTEFSSFLLAGFNQLHDLHSKLILDHPRGFSRQLHKCIVTDSSGHAVFDGNVKVNRYAQQTDAGQLSRSLLLAPRATVNVKPNLQIIANDVKCSHGAAISDLEEEQLFYFRARGIDTQTARSALVFSFGAEVVQKLDSEDLKKRVEHLVKDSLSAEGVIKADLPVSL